jgi:hypothetical protein
MLRPFILGPRKVRVEALPLCFLAQLPYLVCHSKNKSFRKTEYG